MRRHLRLFEDDVLALDRVVLLELKFVGLGALVLGRVVGEARTGRRNEANVLSHGTRGVTRGRGLIKGREHERTPKLYEKSPQDLTSPPMDG